MMMEAAARENRGNGKLNQIDCNFLCDSFKVVTQQLPLHVALCDFLDLELVIQNL